MLTLIMELNKRDKKRQKIGLFKCDCGKEKELPITSVTTNAIKSCGCSRKGHPCYYINKKHGMYQSPEYRIWLCIKARCKSKNSKRYKDYAGRGIKVCNRWVNSFENFYNDMGEKPSKYHVIDRKNNDGDYTPDNCKWSTPTESLRNTRKNVFITYNGETRCLSEWSEILGGNRNLVSIRKRLGWSDKRAVSTPYKKRNKKALLDEKLDS